MPVATGTQGMKMAPRSPSLTTAGRGLDGGVRSRNPACAVTEVGVLPLFSYGGPGSPQARVRVPSSPPNLDGARQAAFRDHGRTPRPGFLGGRLFAATGAVTLTPVSSTGQAQVRLPALSSRERGKSPHLNLPPKWGKRGITPARPPLWIPAPYRVRGRLFAGMTVVQGLPRIEYGAGSALRGVGPHQGSHPHPSPLPSRERG